MFFNATKWPTDDEWVEKWGGSSGWEATAGTVRFLMFAMIGQGDVKEMQQRAYAGAPGPCLLARANARSHACQRDHYVTLHVWKRCAH